MPRTQNSIKLLQKKLNFLGIGGIFSYRKIASRCLYHALSNTNENECLKFIRFEVDGNVNLLIRSKPNIQKEEGVKYYGLDDIKYYFGTEEGFKLLLSFHIEDSHIKDLYDFLFFNDFTNEIECNVHSDFSSDKRRTKFRLLLLQSFCNHERAPKIDSDLTEAGRDILNKIKTAKFDANTTQALKLIDEYIFSLR